MPSVLEVLSAAIRDAATVSIVYNGGSRPGQSRILIPLSVSSDELVAREPTARVAKTFKLYKVASATLANGDAAQNEAVVPPPIALAPVFGSFSEYCVFFRQFVGSARFNITEGENYFAITGFFRNGKPRKTPAASIQYMDRTVETVLNIESGEIEEVKRELTGRERPWRVDSALLSEGKSFAQLPRAAEFFLEQVQACDRNTRDAEPLAQADPLRHTPTRAA